MKKVILFAGLFLASCSLFDRPYGLVVVAPNKDGKSEVVAVYNAQTPQPFKFEDLKSCEAQAKADTEKYSFMLTLMHGQMKCVDYAEAVKAFADIKASQD